MLCKQLIRTAETHLPGDQENDESVSESHTKDQEDDPIADDDENVPGSLHTVKPRALKVK